jgi:hypothetical protein
MGSGPRSMPSRPNSRRSADRAFAKKDEPDDFVSVARRLGADESKERFERKLGKIALAKSSNPLPVSADKRPSHKSKTRSNRPA